MNFVDQALELLKQKPVPEDVRKQIDSLYEKANDEEKPLFSMIYEGLFLLENSKNEDVGSREYLR